MITRLKLKNRYLFLLGPGGGRALGPCHCCSSQVSKSWNDRRFDDGIWFTLIRDVTLILFNLHVSDVAIVYEQGELLLVVGLLLLLSGSVGCLASSLLSECMLVVLYVTKEMRIAV